MNRALFLTVSATSTILAGQIIATPAFAQRQLGNESSSVAPPLPAPNNSSPNASEEQSASQASPESGEIIVTANKRSESVNRVPLSITAASGEKMTQLGVKSAGDLAKIVPGFTAVTTQSNTPVYYLRGVGFYDTSISARPTVSIYADEAPLPYSVMAMGSALDLERVEVLKGPQGTLFGSNSTGGAINFVAAKPTNTFSAGVDVSFGRFNDLLVSGFVSGPLAEGVKARLAASHEGASDWQRSYTRNATNGSKNTTSGRLIIDVEPTDRLTLKFAAAGTINKSDSQTGQLVGKVPPFLPEFAAYPLAPANARATDFGPQMPLGHTLAHDDWQFQGSLRADYEINDDIKLTSLTSYVKNRQRFGQDPDATSLVINDLYIDGNLKSFNQEIRLSGTLSERARWVLGANYQSDKTHEVINYSLINGIQGHAFDFLGENGGAKLGHGSGGAVLLRAA